jgi:cyclic pyranopterin phosphate synthase
MPNEDIRFMPSANLMQAAEIDLLAREFVNHGVKKIRLTGGEPLVRKDAKHIIELLSKYPIELTLTTNGFRLHEFIDVFKTAGVKSVNISLDTLDKDKFKQITQRDAFERVMQNIDLMLKNNFHVKVNAVVMRGFNDNEITDFVAWTKNPPLHIRFIEFMPFTGNKWEDEKVFSFKEIIETVEQKFSIIKLKDDVNATAKKYNVPGHVGTFAIISTMSAPFCSTCNRMRLTADGKMKNCLFSKGEVDLLGALRKGENLKSLIKQCLFEKSEALGGQFTEAYKSIDASKLENRSMINIGG